MVQRPEPKALEVILSTSSGESIQIEAYNGWNPGRCMSHLEAAPYGGMLPAIDQQMRLPEAHFKSSS